MSSMQRTNQAVGVNLELTRHIYENVVDQISKDDFQKRLEMLGP